MTRDDRFPSGGTPGFEVRLLGPVGVVRAGREVGLGGPGQRAVLALLLLEGGQVVPTDRLVEEVWRGGQSPGVAKTLRSYVSRLRALLDPDVRLVARGGGYVLSVDRGLVDASRFEWLAAARRRRGLAWYLLAGCTRLVRQSSSGAGFTGPAGMVMRETAAARLLTPSLR